MKVYADGEDTGVAVNFKIDNVATGKAKLYSVSVPETAKVNEPLPSPSRRTRIQNMSVFFNENGMGLAPISCTYEDVDGVRVWTYVTSVGSVGIREFHAGVASADRVFTQSRQTVSIQVRR